jgi:hypothetical protein
MMSPNEVDFMGKVLLSIIAGFARGVLLFACATALMWAVYTLIKHCRGRLKMATIKKTDKLVMKIYLIDGDEIKDLVMLVMGIAADPDVPQRVKSGIQDWISNYNEKHPSKEI